MAAAASRVLREAFCSGAAIRSELREKIVEFATVMQGYNEEIAAKNRAYVAARNLLTLADDDRLLTHPPPSFSIGKDHGNIEQSACNSTAFQGRHRGV